MTDSAKLNIPYLEIGQREKEAAINAAWLAFDTAAYTFAGVFITSALPAAADWTDSLSIVTDAGAGNNERWLCYSDGTNWRQITLVDYTIVA